MYKPNYIEKYKIYDILYNTLNQIIIIVPFRITRRYNIQYVNTKNNTNHKFNVITCPHGHTYIYSLNMEYSKNIKLLIDNVVVETTVNRYPNLSDNIILSTMVKNEDNYVKQWIEFHRGIGVDKFIIYDNANGNDNNLSYTSNQKYSNLSLLLDEYIKNNIVILIDWPYPKRTEKGSASGQTTQQNHSIYAFRTSKYIGLFDIDEYINMQKETNIKTAINNIIENEKLDLNNISCLTLKNRFFYNPKNLPVDGYNFLKIYNCSHIVRECHVKSFVIPNNTSTYSIHKVTSGKPSYNIEPSYLYFNHYYFLNKSRGKKKTDKLDDSISIHTKNLIN